MAKPHRKEIAWSPKLAYAVGLLATDGGLSINGRHIDLTSKDQEQLENFMYCIDKQMRISVKHSSYTNGPVTRVQFSDVTLYKFLVSIGLTPHKSRTIGKLSIPDPYFSDFLRGHHDGDGSFHSYFDPRWKNSFMYYLGFLSASEQHILWLQNMIERCTGAHGHISFSKNSCVRQLRYAKKESLTVLNYMYPSPDVICLSRKRLKIEEALGIVGQSLPT